jgi:hypothetical protein
MSTAMSIRRLLLLSAVHSLNEVCSNATLDTWSPKVAGNARTKLQSPGHAVQRVKKRSEQLRGERKV